MSQEIILVRHSLFIFRGVYRASVSISTTSGITFAYDIVDFVESIQYIRPSQLVRWHIGLSFYGAFQSYVRSTDSVADSVMAVLMCC